ncbi:MAG: iron-only hydrogenase system regulator [Oscillospiraceae bacterium]|nr:iron-only hydrogenase system regulator [Oscillospiraceae bacterium]
METRVAIIGIIVENPEQVGKLNAILHEYSQYIIGRMGIPYPQRKVSIISVAVDAPQSEISALSGKIGRLQGISAKTVYSNIISESEKTDSDE